jgi:hypothetical protein
VREPKGSRFQAERFSKGRRAGGREAQTHIPYAAGGWACDAGSGIGSAVPTDWATAVLDESTSIRSIARRRIEMGVKVGSMGAVARGAAKAS